ncbi:patr class I histocompatibility antigen, B-2 alpha chain-like [Triplophysa dalaica]|uniref:patr class I histocompatibility antigen, B-2 alpha chain-like n=1 Tax=Triplophysa dalaica TaxID=1582913 RepID=UPI0024DF31C5|nr:patr class I histocompatibility antigen, B-2 alpha chain-like [Triplophysa dalaica]
MRSIVILLLSIPLAFAGPHCLKYLYTVASGDVDIPEVTAVGLVDDQQFMYFDSDTMKAEPKIEWIKADQWDRQTEIDRRHYHEYRNNMLLIKNVFNQSTSEGVHTLQVMYGCEIRDDGTTRGFYEFGYDGEDFITFDKNALNYIAANRQADIIKNKMDSNKPRAQLCKVYLENTCIDRLKKYMSYSKDNLQRKVPPEVSILQKDSSSPVTCHATGFYTSNINMTWQKNHEELHENVEVHETLPNADGTFQKRISLSMKSEELNRDPDVYRCVIQHVGAEKEIVKFPSNITRSNEQHASWIITVPVLCVLPFAVAIIIGCIVMKKTGRFKCPKSTGYAQGSTTDEDSKSDEQMQNVSS